MYPNGYHTDVDDSPGGLDVRYLPNQAVLPRWLHLIGVAALAAGCIWAGLGLGILERSEQQAYQYTHQEGWALVHSLMERARADRDYTVAEVNADTDEVWRIQNATRWSSRSAPVERGAVGTLRDLAATNLAQRTLIPDCEAKTGPLNRTQHTMIMQQARVNVAGSYDDTHCLAATANWGEFWSTIGLMYLLALPFALIVLLSRSLVASRTLNEAIGIWRASWRELIAATVFWPIGMLGYRPDCQVLYRAINDLAAARGSHVQHSPIWSYDRPTCPIWLQAEVEVMSYTLPGRELLRAIWSKATTPTPQPWPQRTWSLGNRLLQASYATVALCIILPLGKVVAADGSMIMTDTLDDKGAPSLTMNLGDRDWRVWLFGANQPKPLLEGSMRVGSLQWDELRISVGLYGQLSLYNRTLQQFGLSGFFTAPLAGGMAAGPWYLGLTPQKGGGIFNAPNSRLLWDVGSGAKLGIGWSASTAHGARPGLMVGPYAQFDLGSNNTQLRLRWADDPRHFDGEESALMCELYSRF